MTHMSIPVEARNIFADATSCGLPQWESGVRSADGTLAVEFTHGFLFELVVLHDGATLGRATLAPELHRFAHVEVLDYIVSVLRGDKAKLMELMAHRLCDELAASVPDATRESTILSRGSRRASLHPTHSSVVVSLYSVDGSPMQQVHYVNSGSRNRVLIAAATYLQEGAVA